MKKTPLSITTLLMACALGVSALDLPDLGDSALANLPTSEEREISDMVARELRRSGELNDDPELDDYLNRLGQKLVAASKDNRNPFRFFAVQSSQINAFAVPGGVVAVNTGLIILSQHESELAGVMGHEIAHVTQHHYARMVESQKGSGLMTLGTLALAILAASHSRTSDAPMAAIAVGQGYQQQRQLAFSRDYEREADRIGMATLQAAEFDPAAMPAFFDRMQKHYRNVDNGAFAFLRTHPVTVERISDSQARVPAGGYKQWSDSLDYLLIRERLRVKQLGRAEALQFYAGLTRERRFSHAAAVYYGQAQALLQDKQYEAAWQGLEKARKESGVPHAGFEVLAGDIRLQQGRYAEAAQIFAAARAQFPSARALRYGEMDAALQQKQGALALRLVKDAIQENGSDAQLYRRQAQAYALQEQPQASHRAYADYYALQGEVTAAIRQLHIAKRSGSDYFQNSAIEARLKELNKLLPKDKYGRVLVQPGDGTEP